MRFTDVIARKRDGHPLDREAIDAFVQGATGGSVPDYQLSALLMAIVWRGMTPQETAWLTDAMLRSGDRVDLSLGPLGTDGGRADGSDSTDFFFTVNDTIPALPTQPDGTFFIAVNAPDTDADGLADVELRAHERRFAL